MKPLLCALALGIASVGPGIAQDSMSAGDAEAGAVVFKKCLACHKVGPNAENGVGPALNGVIGREAGTHPGYNYSAAMRDSGIVWNEAELAIYLAAPRKVVPGTRMAFPGLKKDQDIVDVIAFLRQFGGDEGQASDP